MTKRMTAKKWTQLAELLGEAFDGEMDKDAASALRFAQSFARAKAFVADIEALVKARAIKRNAARKRKS